MFTDNIQRSKSQHTLQFSRVDRGNYNNTKLSSYHKTNTNDIEPPKGSFNQREDKWNTRPHRHLNPQSTLDSWRKNKGDSKIIKETTDSSGTHNR